MIIQFSNNKETYWF